MKPDFQFHTRTPLALALRALLAKLAERLQLQRPLDVYIAGGMAVHLYTAGRVTTDVDAEFGARVLIPSDLSVEIDDAGGRTQMLYLDGNYNASFALMHEDYLEDAIDLELEVENIRVHILSPVDLAVSKIARLGGNDRDDIRALVLLGLTNADEIEARATQALGGYIGSEAMLRANLHDALAIARNAESGAAAPPAH